MKLIISIIFLLTIQLFQSALASGATFDWNPRSFYASSTSNRVPTNAFGTLVTVDGKGGPGDSVTLSDIVSFTFTHEWEDSVTGETGINVFNLANLTISSSLIVSDDGAGFDSGSIFVDIGTNRLRMVANAANPTLGDVNDNYVVDEPAQNGISSNGWNGGSFGAWINASPETVTPVSVPLPIWSLLALGLIIVGLSTRVRS